MSNTRSLKTSAGRPKRLARTVPAAIEPGRERRLPPLLRRTWYRLNQTFRRRIAGLHITPDQFTILRWLTENPEGITQKELAQLMASDANTIAAALRRMEEAGMISRRSNGADRREKILRILATGRRKFQLASDVAYDLQTEVTAAIPESQRETFLRNLARLAQACESSYERSRDGGPDSAKK